ncbi:MAG: hypothetical protein D6795_16920 [Deltaproteobacteria bacterium]|nr:MAG: hypothetical protein D6795_16920 [Deltaproteobacteria bacterium]
MGGHPIQIRCQGELFPLQGEPLDPKEVRFLLDPLMTPEQQEKLQREKQLTFSFEAGKSGRFRVHVHRSGGALCATLRVIPERTHTLSALHLPQRISSVLELGGGIVLVCGSARSGKSTTLCALVNELLHKRGATVSWLQAPLEQTIAPTQGIVKYLEVGEDTPSYAATLASIHLQDPDVVVVNEIEDMESLQALFDLTEAGITVIATTHAGTIPKALHRLSALFPPERRSGACREMAGTLRAVVCQRLLPKRDGNGSVPAVAFMINNAPIRRRIEQGKFDEIPHLLHIDQGMQSFELAIKMLRQDGLIDPDTAASHLGMLSSPIG